VQTILCYHWVTHLPVQQSNIAHALRLSVFSSRLLAKDLSTETNTSSHYEVFLLFCLQSLWNLGTKNSSGLTPPAFDWFITALNKLSLPSLISTPHRPHGKHRLYCWWHHRFYSTVQYVEMSLLSHCLETGCITSLFRLYRAVAWQCVDQICYNMIGVLWLVEISDLSKKNGSCGLCRRRLCMFPFLL
jgi:hypothetical protein